MITHSYFSFRLPYKLRHSKTHPTQASIEIYPVENRQTELPINYKNPLYWLYIPLPRYKVSYICWHPYKRSTLRTCLVGKLLTQVYTYLSTSKMLRYFGWPTCQLALQNYDMRKDMMRDQFLLLTIRQVNNWNRILCFFLRQESAFPRNLNLNLYLRCRTITMFKLWFKSSLIIILTLFTMYGDYCKSI